MNNIAYFTLAAARLEDPMAFDAAVKKAVDHAAKTVGAVALARSLSSSTQTEGALFKKVA